MKTPEKDPFDKSNWTNMTNEYMFCPACKTQLVKFDMRPLETLDEHICESFMSENAKIPLKAAYRCPVESCVTRQFGRFWNYIGDIYVEHVYKRLTSQAKEKLFVDGNDAPFGSWQRKSNKESKNVERKLVTLPLWFPNVMSGMTIYLVTHYRSNYNGDLLSRYFSLKYVTKYSIIHIWGLRMLKYGFREIFKAIIELRKNPDAAWHRKQLVGYIERESWGDNEWWRILSAKLAKLALRITPSDHKLERAKKIKAILDMGN